MFLYSIIVVSAASVFGLAASNAYAFFHPPWVTPAAPRLGETVSVTIRGGICDSYLAIRALRNHRGANG
jgi:hypothetical protein